MFDFLKKLRDSVMNAGGKAIGDLELVCPRLRYPVNPYRDVVDPEKLWRGSRPSRADLEDLQRGGFKTVVSFCAEMEDPHLFDGVSLSSRKIPVVDNTVPTTEQLQYFIDLATHPELWPIYCHCEAGIGRTSVFCAAYRVFIQHWTADQALDEAIVKYKLAMPCQVDFISNFRRVAIV